MPVKWLTESQACEHVDRSPRTLRMWRLNGEVQFHRQSKTDIFYDADSLNACVSRQAYRLRDLVSA